LFRSVALSRWIHPECACQIIACSGRSRLRRMMATWGWRSGAMDRPRRKLAIVLVVLAAVIAAWLLLRSSRRAPADGVRAPKPAQTARPERPRTLRLPAATISPGET